MQIRKFKLLMAVIVLFSSMSYAQNSGSGYSAFDSSVITKKGKPQQNQFLNHAYNFPAKPRDMWEIGLSTGAFTLSSDVSAVFPVFGFSAHVRKSFGYTFSMRMEYLNGTAKGLNWKPSANYAKNSAWTNNDYKGSNVYYNYKNKTQDLSVQALVSLSNIRFHKDHSKVVAYAGVGFGASAYETKINARNESTGNNYIDLFNNVANNIDGQYSNRKNVLKALKDGMDGTYEEAAESHNTKKAKMGSQTLCFSTSVLAGLEYKIAKRINLALEDRHTFVHDDLLDGQRWQEHPQGDAALTPNFDTYNYLSLGLNFNLGSKSVEPLWWINPLDYAYGELNKVKKMPKITFDDADGDGVVDQLDREPNTPAGAPVDAHGVSQDTDGDGVPDYKDKQLITPSECQPVDADGVGKCPEPDCCKNPPKVVNECPSSYPSLSFKNNAATLELNAKDVLSAVSSKLKANPTCTITVNGYPEASKASQALCQQRTDAVKTFMVQKLGISADRITTNCEIGGGDKNTLDIKAN